MADTSKKTNSEKDEIETGDPLFTLHHAQAEAELAEKNGGLGPTTNVYVTKDERDNIDAAIAPVDSQGFTRGEEEPGVIGTNAGGHS